MRLSSIQGSKVFPFQSYHENMDRLCCHFCVIYIILSFSIPLNESHEAVGSTHKNKVIWLESALSIILSNETASFID